MTGSEAKSLDSRRQLEAFIRECPACVAQFDLSFRCLAASHRWLESNRLDESAFGKSLENLCPDIALQLRPHFQQALAGNSQKCDEEMLLGEDGSEKWIRWEIVPWHDSFGGIGGVLLYSEDISDRKNLEEDVWRKELIFRKISDSNLVGVGIGDSHGQVSYVNEEMLRMMGRTREEFESGLINWEESLDPDFRDEIPESLSKLQNQGGVSGYKRAFLKPDGSRTHFIGAAALIHPETNLHVSIALDLTGIHEAEQALREREARYRTLFSSIDEGFCLCEMIATPDGRPCDYRFLEVNPHFETMTGLRHAAGKTAREIIPNIESHWIETYARVGFGGETLRFENKSEAMGRWFTVFAVPVKPAGRFALVFSDITRRKEAEAALQAAKEHAEAANLAKDRFIATLSHELRNPLNPVLLVAGQKLSSPELAEAERSAWEIVVRNIQLEARLIDDLLDLTRVVQGKMSLQIRNVDVHQILSETLDSMCPEASERKVELVVDCDAPSSRVHADPARLQQVFWNLLSNAVKFTPYAGRIEVKTFNEPPEILHVQVTDNGLGMVPGEIEQIFQPFAQGVQAPDSKRIKGLGLGLAISRMILEMHHGKIRASSPGRGQGATFHVELNVAGDLARADSPGIALDSGDQIVPENGSPGRSGTRILLVEDHDDTRRILELVLESAGFSVASASSSAAAVATAREHRFDLILSDLGLPDGHGHQLIRELHNILGPLPAIALSGYGMPQDVEKSKSAGYRMHLTKPVDFDALTAAIQELGF